MANSQFFSDDINIADFRILISLWDREQGDTDFYVDVSNIATSEIRIEKERNCPDILTVKIEYTQFLKKLNYEGSNPENILMPFLTEVKIQRNFETVFAGTLFHMTLALGAVGKEILELKCCSWGQHYEKRYVSEGFRGSYPQIAQQLVLAGQHEMNWFDNYAFEYTDEYFEGWKWSAATDQNPNPPRSNPKHWEGGVYLTSGQSMWTYSMINNNTFGDSSTKFNLKPLRFRFWYRANSAGSSPALTLSAHGDNNGDIGTQLFSHSVSVSNQGDWTQVSVVIPAKTISQNIHWLKLTANNINIDISDLSLYTEPEQGDPYDLDISLGTIDAQGHQFDNSRIRHYHRQNIKDALYNVAKLVNAEGLDGDPDNFEYEFDENKVFNIYYRQGQPVADPAFAATYPGIIKSLTLERGLEEICNIEYASAEETKTYKNKAGEEQTVTKKWAGAYASGGSMQRFGAMVDFKDYESVHSYSDLDIVGGSDLNIFDEVQNIPEIEVDSNIYNLGNIHLGDAVVVKVLADPVFEFANGVYRIYSIDASVTIDSVEKVRITLVPVDMASLQIISFPKQYKYLMNDMKRLMTGG